MDGTFFLFLFLASRLYFILVHYWPCDGMLMFALADFFCWGDVVCETSGTHTTLISCDNSLFTNGRVMVTDHDFIPLLREKKQLSIAELCPLLCDKLLGSDRIWENDKLERQRTNWPRAIEKSRGKQLEIHRKALKFSPCVKTQRKRPPRAAN